MSSDLIDESTTTLKTDALSTEKRADNYPSVDCLFVITVETFDTDHIIYLLWSIPDKQLNENGKMTRLIVRNFLFTLGNYDGRHNFDYMNIVRIMSGGECVLQVEIKENDENNGGERLSAIIDLDKYKKKKMMLQHTQLLYKDRVTWWYFSFFAMFLAYLMFSCS